MDINLQLRASVCHVTGQAFEEGQRVLSLLINDDNSQELTRVDMLESAKDQFNNDQHIACSWVQPYKPRNPAENPERELKMTAEGLFTTLADPSTEPNPENTGLIQFLSLVLERKKILRPKGTTPDGRCTIYEHAKTKQLYEVPVGELTPEFFISIQEQMGLLFGQQQNDPKETASAQEPPTQDDNISKSEEEEAENSGQE